MKTRLFSILLAAMVVFGLTSCSTTSHTVSGVNMNGTYVLESITVNGIDSGGVKLDVVNRDTATIIHSVKVNTLLFDDASPACFQNSVWVLPHNGNGTYTINGGTECGDGTRNIVWSVRNDQQSGQKKFQLKVINGTQKPKNVTVGYMLDISNITASGFTLYSPTEVDGKQCDVYYNFVRRN